MSLIWTILPRSCDEEHLNFLALKCKLTHKNVVNRQQVRPALVNAAFQKLNMNPFYSNITTDNELEGFSDQ